MSLRPVERRSQVGALLQDGVLGCWCIDHREAAVSRTVASAVHAAVAEVGEYLPLGQRVHRVAPALLPLSVTEPAGQGVQAVALVLAANRPAGHTVHSVAIVSPPPPPLLLLLPPLLLLPLPPPPPPPPPVMEPTGQAWQGATALAA